MKILKKLVTIIKWDSIKHKNMISVFFTFIIRTFVEFLPIRPISF